MRKSATSLLMIAALSMLALSGCTSTSQSDQATPSPSKSAPQPSTTPTLKFVPRASALPPATMRKQDAQVQADLARAKAALNSYSAAHNGSLPSRIDASSLKQYGWKLDPQTFLTGYQLSIDPNPDTFCLTAGSNGATLFTITSHTKPTFGGLCPDKSKW